MKNVNRNAPVKCSRSISINADSKKVWDILTDINNWATWQSEIKNPKLNGELKPATTFDWKTGGAKIHSTLHTVISEKEFGWTGKTFGMVAIHNWVLSVKGSRTIVSVDESMEGFLASLFKKAFNRNLEKAMLYWLEQLKKEAEKKV
ncbi:SRPBCC family protein [Lacibacter sp. H407]|uniref:SRPBCC family protein n=1 Tax=Lacibacter sp. H407 TaxID=3133423 RepID=UPI0030C36140